MFVCGILHLGREIYITWTTHSYFCQTMFDAVQLLVLCLGIYQTVFLSDYAAFQATIFDCGQADWMG